MANEDRSRTAFLAGLVDDNPLTAGATTLTATELASLPAIGSTEHAVIVLDPNGDSGAPEIVYVTAHTASATTATIARGQEGTTGRQHDQNTRWYHGPTLREITKFAFYDESGTGNWTTAGTSHAAVDTGTDLVLPGTTYAGDVIEVGAVGSWQATGGSGVLDVVTFPGSINTYIGDPVGAASGFGVRGWYGFSAVNVFFGGSMLYEVVSADLSSGVLTLRLVFRHTSTAKILDQSQFHWFAKNHGPLHV